MNPARGADRGRETHGEIGVGLSRRDYAGIRLIEDEASATAALTWALKPPTTSVVFRTA